ncbi:transglutaminase domain-containing protein [Flavicella marina]|uniref:transglutaminase domain-containing protein n=1 Tax=Flavicella marina TaxID=1475951 RepID=UPI00186B291C|nr:transglutaminase domain-containing protein [Flavicella marina]
MNTTAQEFHNVDSIAKTYDSNINSLQLLTAYIERDFDSDIKRARALFVWLTANISYDLNDYNYGPKNYKFNYASPEELETKINTRKQDIVTFTMNYKRAVCEGYAETFKQACDLLNIDCVVISGYTRGSSWEIGKLPLEGNHAWNAMKIKNEWKLVDNTWGAGHSRDANHWVRDFDDYYFLVAPEELITSHYPEDKNWQLLSSPLNEKEFTNQPNYASLFFKEELQLIAPTTGIISGNDEFISIKLIGASNDTEFGYAFDNDYYLTTIIPEINGGITTLNIPRKNKKKIALKILIDTDMIVKFYVD